MSEEQQQAAQHQGQVAEAQMMMEMQNKEADTASKRAAAIHSEAMADEAIARSIQARAQAAAALQNADTSQFKAIADAIDAQRTDMIQRQKLEVQEATSRRDNATAQLATIVSAHQKQRDTDSKERQAAFSTASRADTANRATQARANQPKPGAKGE
jgi:hypothetical protein